MATQQQMEMERRLPDASPNLCRFVWDHLHRAGISIDPQTIRFIGKIISEYVKNTEDGKNTVFKLLGTEFSPGSPTQTYYQAGRVGDETAKIQYTDLMEYHGWVYKKVITVAHSAVAVIDRSDKVGCEDCGILGPRDYCIQRVLTRTPGGRENLEDVCNHCRTFNTDPRVRDTACKSNCENCPVTGCEHYPKKQLALLGPPLERRHA